MINIEELEMLANKKEKENYRFRSYLKTHADEEKLDQQFKRLHEKYFKIYDCKKCRNCCKKLGISIDEYELDNICNYLNFNKEKFIKENLIQNYNNFSFKGCKCRFLDENNNCKISKCLPITCKEYPYTNKEERLFSLYSIVSNASICPVVYEILEELKKEYNFKLKYHI